jgi:alpha-1,2-mannosyltransferase
MLALWTIPMVSRSQPNPVQSKLFNFAALISWSVASATMAVLSLLQRGEDFRGYYAAARVLLKHGNPYDYKELAPILLEVTGRVGNNPYYYPPWFAWLFVPFALMPYDVARGIWMLVNLVLWGIGLWLLSRLLEWPSPGWQRWLIFLFATFQFAWITLRYEQTGILLFVLLVAALTAIRKRNWFWTGCWLALLLIKPNITLIPVLSISIWMVRLKRWKPILLMVLFLACLLFATTLATPYWFHPLLQPGFDRGLSDVLDGPNRVVADRVNSTLIGWLTGLRLARNLCILISILAAIFGGSFLVHVILRSTSLMKVVIVSLLVSFAVTPYALQYDYPLLSLPLLWAMALYTRSPQGTRGGVIITVLIASTLVWERPISDGYWIVLGLVVLTFWSYLYTKFLTIPESLLLSQV